LTTNTTASGQRTPRLYSRNGRRPLLTAGELIGFLRSAVAVLLAAAAIFIASRRLAGALDTSPLPIFPLFIAGLSLAVLAAVAHMSARIGRNNRGNGLVSLAIFTVAAAISLWGSGTIVLLGFWAVIAGEEIWAWRGLWPVAVAKGGQATEASGLVQQRIPSEEREPEADVLQQLTLRGTAEGGQELSGWLRVSLEAGQRTASLHVAFCPAFDNVPIVQAEPVSGPPCRIKAAQVLPYGARLEVKLDDPACNGESVLVWFHAASQTR
jgi:MFS family permease